MERDIPNDERFIAFTSDYGFKVTFGNEENTLFLRKALQALIGSKVAIKKIAFIKTNLNAVTDVDRSIIFDLFCKDENNETYIVEMQLQATDVFLNRLKFYAFHSLNRLVKKGKFNFNLKTKIYCIAFLGTNIFSFEEIGRAHV